MNKYLAQQTASLPNNLRSKFPIAVLVLQQHRFDGYSESESGWTLGALCREWSFPAQKVQQRG